jgi:hypothetical protein
MSPADFLRAECGNVQDTLDETLRHDYGFGNRHEYYAECSFRLKVLQARLEKVPKGDQPALAGIAYSLSELSRIISRIERSHLGEFSWPFADELKKMGIILNSHGR